MDDASGHSSVPVPADRGNPALVEAIRAAIDAAGGRLPFARFMELALYHPEHGYYLTPSRRPGRGGDFLTAPETHPFFGLTLARQIAECWERLGRPESFTVREYGAGVGGLAYDVIVGLATEAPKARAALRYRLVEPNQHRLAQALAAMEAVGLGDVVAGESAESGQPLPPIVGVVLANEVADAFPVHRLVMRAGQPRELYVVWRGEWFGEVEGDVSGRGVTAAWDGVLAAGVLLADGEVVEVSPAATDWFAEAGRGLERGYAIVLDYGYPAPRLYHGHRLRGTLRGYAEHTVTDNPYLRIGEQDLTAHVDFTALERAGSRVELRTAGLTTQGAFLSGLGLGDFLLQMQADPATGPADYYAAQAATLRLIDPGGLGRFSVLIMARDAPIEPPLRGLTVTPPPF